MSTPAPSARLAYLDLSKGILVLLMVVYHSLNYTSQYELGFRFLSFLPLSFILITGFLLARVNAPRYRPGDSSLTTKLLVRGARLILLFTLLNVTAQFVRSPSYGRSVGVSSFFNNWFDIYVLGGSSTAAFDVLLPIAYLIALAPFLIAVCHGRPQLPAVLAALFTVTCVFLDLSGFSLANLNFLCVGVIGMAAGSTRFDPATLGSRVWAMGVVYGFYFPLGMYRGWMFAVQVLGALVALAFVCALSVRLGDQGRGQQCVIRLGQYSLVAYIVQIALLQALSRFFVRPDPRSLESVALFMSTLVLMTASIELTEFMRRRWKFADHLYRLAFA